MRIAIQDRTANKYYVAEVSRMWAERHDNGALISIGFTVPDNLTRDQLRGLLAKGKATEISFEEWNHSGCQSACIRRGDPTCRW